MTVCQDPNIHRAALARKAPGDGEALQHSICRHAAAQFERWYGQNQRGGKHAEPEHGTHCVPCP